MAAICAPVVALGDRDRLRGRWPGSRPWPRRRRSRWWTAAPIATTTTIAATRAPTASEPPAPVHVPWRAGGRRGGGGDARLAAAPLEGVVVASSRSLTRSPSAPGSPGRASGALRLRASRSARRRSRSRAASSSSNGSGRSVAGHPPALPACEVGLEQVGSRQRVGRRARAGARRALGHARRQSLVVGLHRHVEDRGERLAKRSRLGGLRPLGPAQRDRQPHDHELRLVLGRQLRDRSRVGRLDHPQRARDRTGGVGDRTAGARGSVIDGQDPHGRDRLGAEGRAGSPRRATCSASLEVGSGPLPPACATVSRPPPPPPDHRGRLADDVGRRQPALDRAVGEAGHQRDLAVARRRRSRPPRRPAAP